METIAELPATILLAMLGLAALGVAMAGRSAWLALTTRRLRARQGELQADIGVLESALVPALPERIAGVGVSAAYRSCEGLAAGGDFLDLLALDHDRIAVIVGDVSGHDRDSVSATALVHYTVRAYVAAGLEPRDALQLTDEALTDRLGSRYATVLAGIYDGERGTLRYAVAGHPPPIVNGERRDHVIEALTPAPIGLGPRTGYRQTEIGIEPGARICLFTDGLPDSRDAGGELIGREGLRAQLERLGAEGGSEELLERLTPSGGPRDDMTVCLLAPLAAGGTAAVIDEIVLDRKRAAEPALPELFAACGIDAAEAERVRVAVNDAPEGSSLLLTVRRTVGEAGWTVESFDVSADTSAGLTAQTHDVSQFGQLVPNRI